MAVIQPPPTYANPITIGERGEGRFNPIWLKWFVDLAGTLNLAGGSELAHNNLTGLQGGVGPSQFFHLTSAEYIDLAVVKRGANAALATQSGFDTDTYVTRSDLLIPAGSVKVGSVLRWTFSVSKTAAGTAAPVYAIRIGSARTVADTSRLTLTGPAQTADADVGVVQILMTVRSVSATGVIQGTVWLDHNLAATGLAVDAAGAVEGTSATFDNTALSAQYIGISIDAGTSAVWSITQVKADAIWVL